MNILNHAIKAIVVGLAIVLTILIGRIVPENQFTPLRIELDSTWAKVPDAQEYMADLNNDKVLETIRHKHINKPGHSIEIIYNNHLSVIGVFGEKEFIVSPLLKFADVNQDGVKEMCFVSVDGHKASLLIMEFDCKSGKKSPAKNIQVIGIDSVSYRNNVPDVSNYEILANKSDIYLDLQAGYSVQPRNIYKYNLITKQLVKTQRNSIVNNKLELLKYNKHDFLLAKKVVVTANTFTQEQAEKFRNSKNADSVKNYNHVRNRIYQYGDFSSYILLYNDNLGFAFKPIEFQGWTNFTLSGFIWNDTVPSIISLTNNKLDDKSKRNISLCNLRGTILKQLPATKNYDQLFSAKDEFVLHYNKNIDIFSPDLKLKKSIDKLTFVSGFFDLTPNSGNEFIAFEKNRLIVFSDNFSQKTSFPIAQEFAPYPENNHIEILQKAGKSQFLFNTHLFYYLFSYQKNEFSFLKYPFYVAVFSLWLAILLLILRFNTMRLEKEKQKLEKTVAERTHELQNKNMELASQKEEIESQSEKIKEQYQRLEKLDRFKESLTHALVHDLKNPLSQIMANVNNPTLMYPARKMLRLIMNMLDVEKYENTEFSLKKEAHSLRNILAEVKSGHEISLKEKNLELHFRFDDYSILADKDVILRVFDNLLANAIRYSPLNQGIDVFAELYGGDLIKISIKNYGEPIAEQALPYIFDKYRHFGKNEGSRSTGLGLTFCKMAVEASGGIIGVNSKPGEGTDFWFTLQFASKTSGINEIENISQHFAAKLPLTETDYEVLKQVVLQVRGFKIYEISRFHEILDPLKETSGSTVNDWVSQLYNAIYVQNIDEFNRLINSAENGQTENTDS